MSDRQKFIELEKITEQRRLLMRRERKLWRKAQNILEGMRITEKDDGPEHRITEVMLGGSGVIAVHANDPSKPWRSKRTLEFFPISNAHKIWTPKK